VLLVKIVDQKVDIVLEINKKKILEKNCVICELKKKKKCKKTFKPK
jgi:hypothetical protein